MTNVSTNSLYLRRDVITSKNRMFTIKPLIPKTKNQKLDAYVMSHDVLTRDYLVSIGITRHSKSIAGIERRCNVEVVPIDDNSWRITK
jgi:hypothetical protein